ncbi:hypothetical protein CE91St36_01780 [Christensenellaceae bacterium]|nr:hypothetical protein CE91St36_01780 [Christensenellaceae bacterium]BDF60029.1 hypothetical protein CE91St37_01790 [Christensenellaceae bacterium]
MSTDEIYIYSIEQRPDGMHLYAEMDAGDVIVDVTISGPVLEKLARIAEKYQIDQWNGFYKTTEKLFLQWELCIRNITMTRRQSFWKYARILFVKMRNHLFLEQDKWRKGK